MSLISLLVDVERDIETEDDYGGLMDVPKTVYSGLSCTINYAHREVNERSESSTQGRAAGPGVMTRTKARAKFEPKPDAVFAVNDRLIEQESGRVWSVTGVRPTYEFTLQLDLEIVA